MLLKVQAESFDPRQESINKSCFRHLKVEDFCSAIFMLYHGQHIFAQNAMLEDANAILSIIMLAVFVLGLTVLDRGS